MPTPPSPVSLVVPARRAPASPPTSSPPTRTPPSPTPTSGSVTSTRPTLLDHPPQVTPQLRPATVALPLAPAALLVLLRPNTANGMLFLSHSTAHETNSSFLLAAAKAGPDPLPAHLDRLARPPTHTTASASRR